MITLMFVLAYAGIGLHTFRYTGAVMAKPYTRNQECEWSSICSACKCVNCGDSRFQHNLRTMGCNDYKATEAHTSDYILALVVAAMWPGWYAYRGYARATVNMVGPSFFKEPSPILTKEQKQALEIKQREDDIAARDARILELEKEAGIV